MHYLPPAPEPGSGAQCELQRSPLQFDAEAYRHFIADSDLDTSQQTELLEAVWLIVVGFVDLGFDQLPVQQVVEKLSLVADSTAVLTSTNTKSDHQEQAGGCSNGRAAGERIHAEK